MQICVYSLPKSCHTACSGVGAILFGDIYEQDCKESECYNYGKSLKARLDYVNYGDADLSNADKRYRHKPTGRAFFNNNLIYKKVVANTIRSSGDNIFYEQKRFLSSSEFRAIGSYPADYNFNQIKQRNRRR